MKIDAWGAVALVLGVVVLLRVVRSPGGQVAGQPGAMQRDAGLVSWLDVMADQPASMAATAQPAAPCACRGAAVTVLPFGY